MESYVLRMEAGGSLPSHDHSNLEECLVLEGDVSFGDFALEAGDYHLAAPSFRHEVVTTRGGALMYIRGEIRDAA